MGDKKFTNFNDVRDEIERQTDQVAGSNKGPWAGMGMAGVPIFIMIYNYLHQ